VFSLQEVQGTAGIGGGNGVCGGQVNPYFAKYSDDACHYAKTAQRLYLSYAQNNNPTGYNGLSNDLGAPIGSCVLSFNSPNATVDSLGYGWELGGAAYIDTSGALFGNGCFHGTSYADSYLRRGNNGFFGGTGDFTIDMRCYKEAAGQSCNDSVLFSCFAPGPYSQGFTLLDDGVHLYVNISGMAFCAIDSLPMNTWCNYRVCRVSNYLYVFLNGGLAASVYFPYNLIAYDYITLGNIKSDFRLDGNYRFIGKIDNVLLSKTGLSTSSYTVPTRGWYAA
jgi:hypothetical protein